MVGPVPGKNFLLALNLSDPQPVL